MATPPQKYLLVIGGATATGKTALSIQLAQHYQTVILSADSRQFYREMNIGTAKPTPEELAQAPHYFINSLSITQPYSVGDYERDALALLEKLYQQHDLVILTGGSGLFIRAVCEGLDDFPAIPDTIRQNIQKLYEKEGLEGLQMILQEVDPDYYEEVDLQNPVRLMRALEVYQTSGKPFSHFRNQPSPPRPFLPIYIKLEMPREQLYARINQRVDQMMEAGLLEEVRALLPYRALNALQTVGYQELFDYLDGKTDLDSAVALITQNSRRYAKRQGTWFRKRPHWKGFKANDVGGIKDFVEEMKGAR